VPGRDPTDDRRGLFEGMSARGRVFEAVSDDAWLGAMLEVEAALAGACAVAGLIPAAAGEAIVSVCVDLRPDPAELGRIAAMHATPVVPLVAAIRAAVPAPVRQFVHFGATSQDVVDSAAMLVTRRALAILLSDVDAAADAAATLASTHRDTAMIGRTLLQQAVPVTFGLTAATWLSGLDAAAHALRTYTPTAQLGGAAGTLDRFDAPLQAPRSPTPTAEPADAADTTTHAPRSPTPTAQPTDPTDTTTQAPHGHTPTAEPSGAADTTARAHRGHTQAAQPGDVAHAIGPAVVADFARRLGLAVPDLPWHTERSRIGALAGALGVMAGALAKPARDITLLAQNEVGEVGEGSPGASSAMPHKHNPVAAVSTLAAAAQAPGLVATLLATAVQEHQRAAGAWQAEWKPLRDLLVTVGSAASWLRACLTGLVVHPEVMRTNLVQAGWPPETPGGSIPHLVNASLARHRDTGPTRGRDPENDPDRAPERAQERDPDQNGDRDDHDPNVR